MYVCMYVTATLPRFSAVPMAALLPPTLYISNIIYTCFTCTKIITLHSVTVDVTVTAVCHIYNNALRVTSRFAPSSLAQKVHVRNSNVLSVVVDCSHNSLAVIVTLAQPF